MALSRDLHSYGMEVMHEVVRMNRAYLRQLEMKMKKGNELSHSDLRG